MTNLIEKALSAKSESKHIEFKQGFDPGSSHEWCELIKDIVAIANSGGGVIIFGLDSVGAPTGLPVEQVNKVDPAEISNKISRYTGFIDLDCEILHLNKNEKDLVAFLIPSTPTPLVFQKPGTYDIGQGKQRNAFGAGTVYFRHGAKSEPGTSDDLRRVIERQLEVVRKSWLNGVKKVVKAPPGAQILTVVHAPSRQPRTILADKVRVVNDLNAIPVKLTRDLTLASGSFVHEEVSDGIFDEINNVIDANRALTKGREQFLLGQPVYYRIYAERQHVKQTEHAVAHLLHTGVVDFYAPALYWALALPDKHIVERLVELYSYPTNRHVHSLIRISLLLGEDFCHWLFAKWHAKWGHYTQPPTFYWKFKEMLKEIKTSDPRVMAARTTSSGHLSVPGESPIAVKELLDKPDVAASLISKACMMVFQGDNECKTIARTLDYLAYGPELIKRAPQIASRVIRVVGDQDVGDLVETDDAT